MKGVRAARRAGARPGRTTKAGPTVCYATLEQFPTTRKPGAAFLIYRSVGLTPNGKMLMKDAVSPHYRAFPKSFAQA